MTANKSVDLITTLPVVQTFEEAFAILKAAGVEPTVINEYDLVDKETLVGVPFIVLAYAFRDGDYGDAGFVSVEAITSENKKIVFNDGSTGIRDQLRGLADRGIVAGIICRNGLRKSVFYFNEETGEVSKTQVKGSKPASTFYLD